MARERVTAIISSACRPGVSAVSRLLMTLLAKTRELQITVVRSSAEATELSQVAAATSSIVIAVGGDGTVADVVTGILGSPARLAIVPAGSTNITARTLGIPTNLTAAITLIRDDHVIRTVDVGVSEDRSFLHMAGAGFDAELFKAAAPRWKRRLGWVAYMPAAAMALRLPPAQVRLTFDEGSLDARSPLILIANGGSVLAPSLKIYPNIAIDDGWLDVLVFTPTTPVEIAATLADAARGRLDCSPHVIGQRTRSVAIEAEPPLAVELDGDPRGATPRSFSIRPAGLGVVTPVIDED